MCTTLMIDVSPVLGESGATAELATDVPLEGMLVGDAEVSFLRTPHARIVLANVGEGILVSGTVEASARVDCARCLEPFDLDLTGTIDAIASASDDPEARGEDQEWYPLQGESVDLLPAVESALRVEVPFAPVHDESCRGICPACGCDRNRDECSCETEGESLAGSPFATLKDLVPPTEE